MKVSLRCTHVSQGSRSIIGFTMVELMVAAGLAAVLMVALFRLLDTALDMWTGGEDRRLMTERGAATAELLAADLRALHAGTQGDLFVDWANVDLDQDGRIERVWPRIRLVRSASMGDVVRLAARGIDPELITRARELGVDVEQLIPVDERTPPPIESGLMEIVWAVVPSGKGPLERHSGVFMRGEALLRPGSRGRFFDDSFFSRLSEPPAGATQEVTGGVLWVGLQFATQTTILWDGWDLGTQLDQSSASWDAWNQRRPDGEAHPWNLPGAGMPAIGERPLLPRRVLVELEFERPADLRRRPQVIEALEKQTASFEVTDGGSLPYTKGRHVLVDGEWMEVVGLRGDRLSVKRAARGTTAVPHKAGATVRFGDTFSLEVPVMMHSDDWNLGRPAADNGRAVR